MYDPENDLSGDHEDYVTGQVRQWLDNNNAWVVESYVQAIRSGNEEAGNDPADSFEDDVEWLGDNLEEFAVDILVVNQPPGIVRYLLSDALSEVAWYHLAEYYLTRNPS